MKAITLESKTFEVKEIRGAFVFYTNEKKQVKCIEVSKVEVIEVEESEISKSKYSNSKPKKQSTPEEQAKFEVSQAYFRRNIANAQWLDTHFTL